MEVVKQNEALACESLEKLTKQYNKIRAEREFYKDLVNNKYEQFKDILILFSKLNKWFELILTFKVKEHETDLKLKDNRIAEDNVRISRLEDQLEEFKEKATNRLAKSMEK